MRRQIRSLLQEKDGIRGNVNVSSNHASRDRTYGSYLQELDPRNNYDVQLALAACPDTRFNEFLERINSTRYRRVSLQTIAKACGIDLLEFNAWWSHEAPQRAIANAQSGCLDITSDMVQDARSKDAPCDRCDGLGWIAAPAGLPEDTDGYRLLVDDEYPPDQKWCRTCPLCEGTKRIRKPGDTHARDRILEIGGIIKRGGPTMAIVQNFGGASHASAVSSLDSMTIDVLPGEDR